MGADSDITHLILDDHEWFRRRFAALDELRARSSGPDELSAVWDPLSARLDVHAIAEEEIFYPQLLRKSDSGEDETLDAIGDHNDIRDGVHDAAHSPVGTPQWWDAVGRAREANDEHMGEEEREGLADFRLHATLGLRQSLGRRFTAFLAEHTTTAGLDTGDKDPQGYVDAVEQQIAADGDGVSEGSLGIGSLKGRK